MSDSEEEKTLLRYHTQHFLHFFRTNCSSGVVKVIEMPKFLAFLFRLSFKHIFFSIFNKKKIKKLCQVGIEINESGNYPKKFNCLKSEIKGKFSNLKLKFDSLNQISSIILAQTS